MSAAAAVSVDPGDRAFYVRSMELLKRAGVPFLVGGAYAFGRYTGIERHTKDFDLFLRKSDYDRAEGAFRAAGYLTELAFPHWLGKAYQGDSFVDLIFSAGNGVSSVDDLWFEHAVRDKVFGVDVELIPAEEMIWSKGLIMERERFDGADVAHILNAVGDKLDWRRLIDRYGEHWRVLLAHFVLYGYIFPSARTQVPANVIEELTKRLLTETKHGNISEKICYGTVLSRQQYLKEIDERGYKDARLKPLGNMSEDDVRHWTAGIAVDGAK